MGQIGLTEPRTVRQSGWGQGYGELGGLGILFDADGADVYSVESLEGAPEEGMNAQGVGVLGGVGILIDVAGADRYTARHYAQGAGFGGTGLLSDGGGADAYTAVSACQGSGPHGTLIDAGGTDTYVCGEAAVPGRGNTAAWTTMRGGLGIDV
jgi:hypothetical protein